MNKIHPKAIIAEDTIMGDNITIGANTVIGLDGFNYPRNKENVPVLPKHNFPVIITRSNN